MRPEVSRLTDHFVLILSNARNFFQIKGDCESWKLLVLVESLVKTKKEFSLQATVIKCNLYLCISETFFCIVTKVSTPTSVRGYWRTSKRHHRRILLWTSEIPTCVYYPFFKWLYKAFVQLHLTWRMNSLELSDPYEEQVLNINGKPITLDDILEETSLYINSSLFPMPHDPGTFPF